MHHIGYLLADNSRLARRAFDERVRADGVTGPQARLLLMLERRLEDAGLVERRPDPNDRRARRLHLTAKSREKLARVRERLDEMVDEMLTGLSDGERQEFVRLLKVLHTNLATLREQEKAANG